MIDPVDLTLLQVLQDFGVQRLGRIQVMAKRLLDHDSTPLSVSFRDQTRGSETRNRHTEEAVRNREIDEAVARGSCCLVESGEMRVEAAVHVGTCEGAWPIAHAVGE